MFELLVRIIFGLILVLMDKNLVDFLVTSAATAAYQLLGTFSLVYNVELAALRKLNIIHLNCTQYVLLCVLIFETLTFCNVIGDVRREREHDFILPKVKTERPFKRSFLNACPFNNFS
jgi:hypothetical protein